MSLFEYAQITENFCDSYSGNSKEWKYILSDLSKNESLLQILDDSKLLKTEVNICDAGVGLGTALYDIYIQSQEISGKSFHFYGIEKNKLYLDFFNQNLLSFWNGKIKLIHGDLTIQKFSDYDIVYSYLPFKENNTLLNFYKRVTSDLKTGSLIVENSTIGKSLLESINTLEKIQIENITIFRKN